MDNQSLHQIGDYQLTKIIGEGTFGTAYEAVNIKTNDTKKVCVKVFMQDNEGKTTEGVKISW